MPEESTREYTNPSDFYTRDGANEGARFYLEAPDGTSTKQWLHVVGAESDLYDQKSHEVARRVAIRSIDAKNGGEVKAEESDGDDVLIAVVLDWSFEAPMTGDGLRALLKEAPYIRNGLQRFITNRANFLGN